MRFTRTICLLAIASFGLTLFAGIATARTTDKATLQRDLSLALVAKFKKIAPGLKLHAVTCRVTKSTGVREGGATVKGSIKGKCQAQFTIKASAGYYVTYPVTATDTVKPTSGIKSNGTFTTKGAVVYSTGHPVCSIAKTGKKISCNQ